MSAHESTSDVEGEMDALYAGDLGTFVERRKTLAARLKKQGQREQAAAVAALAKPTVSAWAVDRLATDAPDDVEALFEVGQRLRDAMRAALSGKNDDGGHVPKLQREQRDRIEALVERSAELLDASGHAANETVLGRVRTTLTTLSTLGGWGDVPPGRLAKDLDPLDVSALAALLALPPSGARSHAAHGAGQRRAHDGARAVGAAKAEHVRAGAHDATSPGTTEDSKKEARAKEDAARAAHARAIAAAERAVADAREADERAERKATETAEAAERASEELRAAENESNAAEKEIIELERALRRAREDAAQAKKKIAKASHDLERARHARDRAAREREQTKSNRKAAEAERARLGSGADD